MRIAIAAHDDRVSPVFDVARRLFVVDALDTGNAVQSARSEVALSGVSLIARIRELKDANISVLICGAISRPLEAALVAEGIEVIPQICGPTDEVLAAFFAKQLSGERYLMPGCCGRRRQKCHGQGTPGPGGNRRGRGSGKQGGQGRSTGGRGCGFGRGGRRSGGKGNAAAP